MFWKKPKGSAYVQKQPSLFCCSTSSPCLGFGSSNSGGPSCMPWCSPKDNEPTNSEGSTCMPWCIPKDEQTNNLDIKTPQKRSKLDITTTGLVSTTNEHVTNNFASYRARVYSLRKSGFFGGSKDDKSASKLLDSNKTPESFESLSNMPSIYVEHAPVKGKMFEKNVKGLKVDTSIRNDYSDSISTASTYCGVTPETSDIALVSEDMPTGVVSVKALREKLVSNTRSTSSNGGNHSNKVLFESGHLTVQTKTPNSLTPQMFNTRKC